MGMIKNFPSFQVALYGLDIGAVDGAGLMC